MSNAEETIEMPEELTVDDIVGAASEAKYHTILEIWSELLKASETTRKEKITVQWAVKLVGTYSGVKYDDVGEFVQQYYDRIDDLRDILTAEIETDDECLNHTSADEDREHNAHHYLNVLVDWQKQFLLWELEWDYADIDAAIKVAVLSEVHKIFFGEMGLTALLDQINFELTDADREYLATSLRDVAEEETGE